MNIFVLDQNTIKCAQYHCDSHCVKMILETAQMLSTAVRECGGNTEGLYKSTHKNHPCSIWARETRANFIWLCELGIQLSNEYSFRYGKIHKSSEILWKCIDRANVIPAGRKTKQPLCMPEHCKVENDVVKSYRNYYIIEKRNFATWKTKTPSWYK